MAEESNNEVIDPNDPKRKANSNDPGWKYCFRPDLTNTDLVECSLCGKRMHSGVKRLKQHLAGGYGDVTGCPKTTSEIIREMRAYMQKTSRKPPMRFDTETLEEANSHLQPPSSTDSTTHPSSGTASKRKQSISRFFDEPEKAPKQTKSVASMLRKTPEEVVDERHTKGAYQSTLESRTRSKEERERVSMHIADFFFENNISFNAANSRSYEIMVESIGQYGPGLKPPSFHELRVPLLEKAKKETEKLREKHEISWNEHGCTLMSDGWTDGKNRHLINFLVNSPEGTFFLESVDASNESQDADLLAGLLEKKIEEIGKDRVVQVVTDNGSNYKAACKELQRRIPTLFWTPCAAHCIDLMLEDIGKLSDFKSMIGRAKCITTFIYRHGKLLHAMREKTNGRDLVRPGVTRFATAFLTLQCLHKFKDALKMLFACEDWSRSKLSATEAGKRVTDIIFSSSFWLTVEDCLRATHPLLLVLRIVDADEKPAMPELLLAMDLAKSKITHALQAKPTKLRKVMDIIESRWADQMGVKLYSAALFLNPSKYFDLKQKDAIAASRHRMIFNDVLEKMITDESLQGIIMDQVTQYDKMRGSFAKQLALNQQRTKSPIDWWDAFGGFTIELQSLAKRIVGLCCTSSGCERNWSTFEHIHSKKRNRLEHKRLNDLVFIKYNRRIATRFQKRQEQGTDFNPLIYEDFQWDNEWISNEIVHPGQDLLWSAVDEAMGASTNLGGRNVPRRGCTNEVIQGTNSNIATYQRQRRSTAGTSFTAQESQDYNGGHGEADEFPHDDEDVEDDFGQEPPSPQHGVQNTSNDVFDPTFLEDF